MAKRFTDTNKWDKKWFRSLNPTMKCFWEYLYTKCDYAGIWEVDFEAAEFFINSKLDVEEIKSTFKNQYVEIDNGKRWFIIDFIAFQYGELSEACKPHKPIIVKLKEKGLYELVKKGFGKGLETLQEKEKEQDKEKEQEQEKDVEEIIPEDIEKNTLENRKSESSGPDFNDVKMFFLDNKRNIEEAIIFWNEYEAKNWIIQSDTGPPRSIKKTKQWQLKAEQWIQKARLRDMDNAKSKTTSTNIRKFAKGSTSIEDINAGLDKAFPKNSVGTG